MEHYPLLDDYINILNEKGSYFLTIVGKDPYPSDAIGIPFCKPSWNSFCKNNVSGFTIIKSLGFDIMVLRSQFLII